MKLPEIIAPELRVYRKYNTVRNLEWLKVKLLNFMHTASGNERLDSEYMKLNETEFHAYSENGRCGRCINVGWRANKETLSLFT